MSTYVVQGLAYFVSHPRLWLATLCPLLLTIVVAFASVIVLFAAALHPQAEGLEDAGVATWLSWLLGVMLVLVEIFLVSFIFNQIILGCYQDKVFEQVMIARGFKEFVEDESRHASCARVCRSCCRVDIWLQILLLIVTLPLNLIPIIGSVVYAWLNGTLLAWGYHMTYFEYKNFSYGQQKAFIKEHKVQYASFGMQAVLMEMIPGFGSLFVFTNTVGAALFAAHLEEEERERGVLQAGGAQPNWDNNNAYNHGYVPSGGIV